MALGKCSYCGHTISDRVPFCPHCGQPVGTDPRKEDDDRTTVGPGSYSPGPGVSREDNNPSPYGFPQTPQPWLQQPPKANRTALWLAVVAVIVSVSACVFFFILSGSNDSTDGISTPSDEETESINGITVRWNGATPDQKAAITRLLDNMVSVDGGTYSMGSYSYDAGQDEQPVHTENVASFKIDRYEATQGLWQAIMGNNPSAFRGDDKPVENVSWNDVQDFISRLNGLTGLRFRLPTEAEWEYAAKGGTLSNGYTYSGSYNPDDVAWHSAKKYGTRPVGSKAPNELGLYDMSGNVYEWTSDHYSNDYSHPRTRSDYVRRGGSWRYDDRYCRVTFRGNNQPYEKNSTIGFRLAL